MVLMNLTVNGLGYIIVVGAGDVLVGDSWVDGLDQVRDLNIW